MGRQSIRILLSIFLIGLGGLLLLANFNLIPFQLTTSTIFGLVIFAAVGLGFLFVYFQNQRNAWWAIIPAFTLLGLAAVVALPNAWDNWGGGIFLGMIGLSFWVIFFTRREMWWAIIPGGVLLTLALVASLNSEGSDYITGALFFIGMGATFLAVYFLPSAQGRMSWALWPAGILSIMGALLLTGATGALGFVVPFLLILAGGVLVVRALRSGTRL